LFTGPSATPRCVASAVALDEGVVLELVLLAAAAKNPDG
jgi:hypothetical protein